MRIAEIAPPWVSVPPPSYGGIELVVSLIADGLVDRGHDVTLFASGGSRTKGTLVSPLEETPKLAERGVSVTDDTIHTLSAYLHAEEFDVIHDHSGWGPAYGALLNGKPPVVRTLHGPWSDEACRFHAGLPTPWPARDSMRTSTGRSSGVDVAACRRAANLRACSGSTRLSPSNTVNSTAG